MWTQLDSAPLAGLHLREIFMEMVINALRFIPSPLEGIFLDHY